MLDTGIYLVEFNQNIQQLALVATPTFGGEVGVLPSQINPNAVAVHTFNSTGAAIDSSFYLAVFS
jgi:hypothetical protein